MTRAVAEKLGLGIHEMSTLTPDKYTITGVGDVSPELVGWTPVHITLPAISGFKDRLFPVLIIEGSPLYVSPHVILGTNVLAEVVNLATESELDQADGTWAEAIRTQTISAYAQAQRELRQINARVRATTAVTIPPETQVPVRCVGRKC